MNQSNIDTAIVMTGLTAMAGLATYAYTRPEPPEPPRSDMEKSLIQCRKAFPYLHEGDKLLECYKTCARAHSVPQQLPSPPNTDPSHVVPVSVPHTSSP